MKKAVAITGPSGSGKTTLIEKISLHLSTQRKIAIIKHDPSNKASVDTDGKDSKRFYDSGADVALVSPERTTLFKHSTATIDEISTMFGDYDLLIVEGLKHIELPRIAVFRGQIESDYLPYIKAIAVDDTVNLDTVQLPSHIEILDLNNTAQIIEWIDTNSINMEDL